MSTVKGIAYWASVTKPNTTFEPVWTIDLVVDKATKDKILEEAKALKQSNSDKLPSFKVDEEKGGFVFKIKQKVELQKLDDEGNPIKAVPPRVIDANNQPFTGNIGNGSEVLVLFKMYQSVYKKQGFVSLALKGVKILTLVPYVDKDEEEFLGASSSTAKVEDNGFDDEIDFK